jgi:hypothetical protein
MIGKATVAGIEMLNELPVNRRAKTALFGLGETVDEKCVHSVQLAQWAIRTGKVEAGSALSETVNAMVTWRPERLMNFLMIGMEATVYEPAGWEQAEDATGLAQVILEDIESKTFIHFPWYGSAQ